MYYPLRSMHQLEPDLLLVLEFEGPAAELEPFVGIHDVQHRQLIEPKVLA